MINDKIPVTIISGFLGSGKTSLINNLIRSYPENTFAIIENEFGEKSIDPDLLIGAKENLVEISNGCICCNRSNDLQVALLELTKYKDQFRHLLIETTGIADPVAALQPFYQDRELKKYYTLDSIITVIDLIHVLEEMKEIPEITNQIAVGDILLLNKNADVLPERLHHVISMCQQINPYAVTYVTQHASLPDEHLLHRNLLQADRIAQLVSKNPGSVSIPPAPKHRTVSSHTYIFQGVFLPEKFEYWMEYFLSMNQENIYRIKGILEFEGNSRKIIFQSVKGNYEWVEGALWEIEKNRENILVFIGKNIDINQIALDLQFLQQPG